MSVLGFMAGLLACPVLLLPFSRSAMLDSGISDAEARAKAVIAVNKALDRPDKKLYLTRQERFENDFLDFQASMFMGRVTQGIFVYEVSEAGCDPAFDEKGERTCTTVCDADPRWFVAVGRDSGSTFRLSGFADSLDEFNRMANELHVYLRKDQDVDSYALFFLSLYLGPETSIHDPSLRVVRSEFQMKQVAEDDFRWNYPERDYETAFEAWLKRFRALKPKPKFEIRVAKTESAYEVVVPVLRLMRFALIPFRRLDKEPILEELSLTISAQGLVEINGRRPLFGRSTK